MGDIDRHLRQLKEIDGERISIVGQNGKAVITILPMSFLSKWGIIVAKKKKSGEKDGS